MKKEEKEKEEEIEEEEKEKEVREEEGEGRETEGNCDVDGNICWDYDKSVYDNFCEFGIVELKNEEEGKKEEGKGLIYGLN